jgi:hypothetical protein
LQVPLLINIVQLSEKKRQKSRLGQENPVKNNLLISERKKNFYFYPNGPHNIALFSSPFHSFVRKIDDTIFSASFF